MRTNTYWIARRPSCSLDIPGWQYFSDNRRADLNKCTVIILRGRGEWGCRVVAWPSFHRNLASVASKAKCQRNDPHPERERPAYVDEEALKVTLLDKL